MTTVHELIQTCPYCSVAEASALIHLGQHAQVDNTIVMIGAGPGELLMAYLEGVQVRVQATVIDNKDIHWAQIHINSDAKIKESNRALVNYVISDSAEFGQSYSGPQIDLLIVDGDHTPFGVQRDIEAFLKHLSIGSRIWFHDYKEAMTVIDSAAVQFGWQELLEVGVSKVFNVI